MKAAANSAPDYQYLLAQANVYRQEHNNTQALTSFAQASNAEGDDQTAQEGLLQAGADEGLRITPKVSMLSDFSVGPEFEDSTVYVLDAKLDAPFPVPPVRHFAASAASLLAADPMDGRVPSARQPSAHAERILPAE